MTDNVCPIGGEPMADGATVCVHCWRLTAKQLWGKEHEGVETMLGDLGAYSDWLDTTISRQDRHGSSGSRSTTTALPFHEKATELKAELQNYVGTWARLVSEERTRDLPGSDSIPALAGWLLAQSEWLRHHPAADDLHRGLARLMDSVLRIINRPPDREYAGVCGEQLDPPDGLLCEGTLYADPAPKTGDWIIKCPLCGTEHDVKGRRTIMLDALHDRLVTISEAARLASYLGLVERRETTRARLAKWSERKLISPHGISLDGDPTYVFGDLRNMLEAAAQRDAARRGRAVVDPSLGVVSQ